MSINIQNVTKVFGKQKALDDVSFEIKSGEIIGFLGPNGAGKTTLMKIITGFIPPTEGDVFVNSLNVMQEPMAVRKIIGYLPEQNPLYQDMYIVEFLNFTAGIYKIKNRVERIEEVIALTGLEPEINKKIGALSKGYKQRVGLAQAIIHDPQVLILDEPTSGLDPNQIIEIRNLIKKLGKEKTVLLSTHIMQEVEAICDRIVIINKGQIVADDDKKAVHKMAKTKIGTLLIEFKDGINTERIQKLNGVDKVVRLEGNKFIIEFDSKIDIRQDIFNLAVQMNNAVLSLQLKEKSLEEVFSELTNNLSSK
ncbi:MAG: gliding motility-associated ABC transporter ATP-binding subunit GldA [Bacteroidales bacterium]|nr:gliding motility-associated ABC transporter ATP-binding subunit GldA [Bacteroidales bacterium]MDD4218269.1 gliding motility-associated ABC transporter ATP-binding subunit GldA [Bacteroidales bacterium]MDY0142295.1 gliding motility-associated ABC transporter ATP-binding subunit GldA [Bacteroidales bacterium]